MVEQRVRPPGRRVVVERVFDVDVPPERAWAVMADTQHLNQLFFGVGAMRLIERGDEASRVRGGFGILGAEFDEYPWVFEVPRRYHSVRVFTRGLLRRLEAECALEEIEGGTRIRYANYIDLPAAVAPLVGLLYRRHVLRGLAAVERMLQQGATPQGVAWPPVYPHADAVRARARPFVDEALRLGPGDEVRLALLVEHLATAPDADVARMRPYELADLWLEPRSEVLACFLRATRAGLLRLSWDLLCPSCENASSSGPSRLRDVDVTSHCDACDVDFSASFEQNVEASFSPSPAVRAAADAVFCYGSPARTPSWLAQLVVPPGEARELSLSLGAGRYRLQAAGVRGRCLLDVREGGAPRVEVRIARAEGGERPSLPDEAPALAPGETTVVLRNDDERPRRVQLAHRAFASRAATAADVTALGLFRDLFADDVLSPEQHIEVGRAAILFTDLVGSTAMYERVGDAQAYALVRDHFRVVEDIVVEEGGRVVKTIGDAVMASFHRSVDATRAAARAIPAVEAMRDRAGAPAGLGLKVGVHEGPCLAVEANHIADYFGRTVNVAARVQGLAGDGELVLSESAAQGPEVAALLEELEGAGASLRRERRAVKGVDGEIEVIRVRPPRDEAREPARAVVSSSSPLA